MERSRDFTTIALPKGRVLKQLTPKLKAAGLNPEVITKKSRELIRIDKKNKVRYFLLKPDDVPTYVEYGAADLGIVGRDVLLERGYDLYAPVDLGIGKCDMVVAGPKNATISKEHTLKVATKFPNIAQRHFDSLGQPIALVFVQGSVELAPLVGLADVIVDIVETGETLRQNGLNVMQTICPISSVVVANRVGLKLKRSNITPLLKALK